jgi:hypothetical protein
MFDNVQHQLDLYDLDPTPTRFEIILHEGSNDIEFQYESRWQNKIVEGAQTNAMSIGIQNYARDDGLQIALLPFDLMGGSDAVVASNQGYLISTNPIPPDSTDGGTLSQGWHSPVTWSWSEGTEDVVTWTLFTVPQAIDEINNRFLVIDTIGSDLNNGNDTEIALYSAAANLVALNDDAVPSLPGGAYLSRLAFGDADGPLPAGDYYLATSAFESDAIVGGENFDWVSTSTAWGSIDINYFYGTDAGALENGPTTTAQQYLDVGEVQWYRFDLPQDILAEDGESLVIDTFDTVAFDTEIGL